MTNVHRLFPPLIDVRVPEPLRDLPYWCLWRYETHAGEVKARKVPYWADGNRRHGTQGGPEDRSRLVTFAVARDVAVRKGFDGVGFAHLDGANIITLDFDNCVVDGKVRGDVFELIGTTYAEYSPSGKGIHAIFSGPPDLLANQKTTAVTDGGFAVEAFSSKGFTTFSGWTLYHVEILGYEDRIAPIPQKVVDACRARFGRSDRSIVTDDFMAGREPPLGLPVSEMQNLLSHLDPSMGREPWLRVGMALHHETQGDDTGLDLWDSWSSEGGQYQGTDDLRYQWERFEQRPGRPSTTMRSVIHMAKQNGYEARKTLGRVMSRGSFDFVPVGELRYRAPEFLIEELIETDTLGLIFGDPGSGKSFLAVDLGLCVATGTAFHGRQVKTGPVFYIAGEGQNGLTRRFAAWARHREVDIEGAPLFMSNRPAQLLDAKSAGAVAEAVHALAMVHGTPALIVIDTLARNYGPGDENSTSDMSKFIAAVDDLKAQFPGCAILIIHHSGHAEKQRARGAMALKGALDFEYRLEKSGNVVWLLNTKMKDAEPPKPIAFELETAELDAQASSAVLIETRARKREKALTHPQALARSTFIEQATRSGVWEDGFLVGLALEPWRVAFLSRHTAENDESKKKAFRRAKDDLVEAGLISVRDGLYKPECLELLAAIEAMRTHRT